MSIGILYIVNLERDFLIRLLRLGLFSCGALRFRRFTMCHGLAMAVSNFTVHSRDLRPFTHPRNGRRCNWRDSGAMYR